ncbi:uncharacterized protein LOC114711041 [Neltuma alba]|uniref:uncharacterized protein LOC114711041 n=1 Tax=Neltuma alba TaxID=207710 RepID=UPI0010A5569F|nr:uncharacterized protein LOC114711041 [Prosopis alba]
MVRLSLLKDLNEDTDRWSIRLKVFRRWGVYQKTSPNELFCITMILVDEVDDLKFVAHSTRVFFNPMLPVVKELIKSAKDKLSPSISMLSQQIPSQSSQPLVACMVQNNKRMDIVQIELNAGDEPFIVNCRVLKLETHYGWTYDGCTKCRTKPKEENGSAYCSNCKKKPIAVELKLKVHYVVGEDTGKTSVIFWDKLAVQLFQKNAFEMKVILKQEDREYDFPYDLDEVVRRKMILKLKLNDYNKRHPHSSISVVQYTICEDLLPQFTQAETDIRQIDKPD